MVPAVKPGNMVSERLTIAGRGVEEFTADAAEESIGDPNGDAGMGAVVEDESEEEMGITHEDVEDEISSVLLAQLGQSSKSHKRELSSGRRPLVSEIYSPPGITREIRNSRFRHLAPAFALDLTAVDPADNKPWDFSHNGKRDAARMLQREQRPILLVGSSMCTEFSTWQYLNFSKSTDKESVARAYAPACMHIRFDAELYHGQLDGNRHFPHEHPRDATSWQLDCMAELPKLPGVEVIRGDHCQYGAAAPQGPAAGRLVKKPVGSMSDSPEILHALSRRCEGLSGECSRPEERNAFDMSWQHMQGHGKVHQRVVPRSTKRLTAGCYGLQAADGDNVVAEHAYSPAQGTSGSTGAISPVSRSAMTWFPGSDPAIGWASLPSLYAGSTTTRATGNSRTIAPDW